MSVIEDMLTGLPRGTPIQEFYRDCSVLVTGGTGFMGKTLIEKLLRSCPSLKQVYIIIRSKKGKDVDTRVEEIFEDLLFSRLKEEVPKFRHRVVAVSGDCALPGLGLSETDRLKLVDQVNIVFHGAATVRFDERIDVAVGINATGTKNMLELARNMIGLKAFIHVSTAYAHCTLSCIEEKFYPSPHSFDQLMATIQNLTDQELEKIMPELLNNIPNTYVYTKAIAESIIKEEAGNLPIGVFRPAIVIGTRSEPLPGWIDNVYGPTGIVVGAGIGILRTINVDPCITANLVPVDMAVGALIASAREVHNTQRKLGDTEGIPIYNYVSSAQKPIQWQEFVDMAGSHGMDIPCSKAIWYYSVTMTKYKVLYMILAFLLHTLPALLVDTVTILCFKKPKLSKVYRKIHRLSGVLTYFCTRNWDFSDDNVQKLWKNLGPEDKKLFDFDISSLDWNQYIYNYVRGCRVHLLKDDLSTVPEAKIRWQSYKVKFESNLNISLRLHIFHSFHIQALLKNDKNQISKAIINAFNEDNYIYISILKLEKSHLDTFEYWLEDETNVAQFV
uniref:Fatty acyl-CoA reductase n=1 Tax=Timema poppense TaxID=170557 RepID=A0A7R9GUA0_TIMPO|nr:unnamed protein product [Timema poppensis]